MSGDVKQVVEKLVHDYERAAIEIFNGIEGKMQALVEACAEVDYKGENAVEFKTTCAQNAVTFANFCTDSMTRMNKAIQTASSQIKEALGGNPIELHPPTAAVQMPPISADVDVHRAAAGPMRALISNAETLFGEIDTLFDDHLREFTALGNEGWIGPEYDQALVDVGSLTRTASEGVTEYRTSLVNYIDEQLRAVGL